MKHFSRTGLEVKKGAIEKLTPLAHHMSRLVNLMSARPR